MADHRRTLELTADEQIVYEARQTGKSVKQVMAEFGLTYNQVANRTRKAATKLAKQERLAQGTKKISF